MSRVLLVEDELWLGELYADLFGREHDVVWARDGYEAVESVQVACPDIIVLDMLLPWASGVQLLHELASYGDTARVPVVLFSAALPDDIAPDALRAYGVVATLDKSAVKPAHVVRTINGVLRSYAQL